MLAGKNNMCEGLNQAVINVLGTKDNMSEGPIQEESVEIKKEKVKVHWLKVKEVSVELKKEMMKAPWLQVQEKIQMSTAEDACLTKIEGRRLLNAIVEDASPVDQNEE